MQRGTIVLNTVTNKKGLVTVEPWVLCSPEEVPVIYEGVEGFDGTPIKDLQVLHTPADITVSHEGCGIGQGEECCAFPIAGGKEVVLRCGRGSAFHEALQDQVTIGKKSCACRKRYIPIAKSNVKTAVQSAVFLFKQFH